MAQFLARRIRFRNGERHSVLIGPNGQPVHTATLFLARFRTKGRAANTIHYACRSIALVHTCLAAQPGLDLLQCLRNGEFLTAQQLNRLASAFQLPLDKQSGPELSPALKPKVVQIARIRMRRRSPKTKVKAVGSETQGSRLRYAVAYLSFLSGYFGAIDAPHKLQQFKDATEKGLLILRAQIPTTTKRKKLGARQAISKEAQERLLKLINPECPSNPWKTKFVRFRNWLIVVILLATGMRRGELLGLRIGDLLANEPKLQILRRPDDPLDKRLCEPNTKTSEREVELRPAIIRSILHYVSMRRNCPAAKKHPHLFVSKNGRQLSQSSIDLIFSDIRRECPDLPRELTSHVMRHTWNDRFSEQAERMGISAETEERARNESQGWADGSEMAAHYTRRYATRKGREINLKMQEQFDDLPF